MVANRRTDNTMVAKRRTDNTMVAKRQKTKEKTTNYKTLQRKQKIEQHEPRQKQGMNSGAHEGLAVPAPLVTPVVLL